MAETSKIKPCWVCVTQDQCRNRGECIQKDAWKREEFVSTQKETKHTPGPWHVGAQNDGLFILNQPPRPSNDDINPAGPKGLIERFDKPIPAKGNRLLWNWDRLAELGAGVRS